MRCEQALDAARIARRDEIRLVLAAGASLRSVASVVGLTHEAVRKIAR